MYNMREIKEEDFEAVAKFEIEISEISFGEKAITDLEFHCKKLAKAKDRRGMIVIEDTESGKIVGWVWMEKKQNSLTGEVYANFKSIYADECIRGMQIVDDLFEKSIEYARECKAAYIVGKVHAGNVPMRSLYKKHCFEPTHVTMERNCMITSGIQSFALSHGEQYKHGRTSLRDLSGKLPFVANGCTMLYALKAGCP